MDILALFCDIDDFCLGCDESPQETCLALTGIFIICAKSAGNFHFIRE